MDHDKIRKEALAVGCSLGLIVGDSYEVVTGDAGLIPYIAAAHGKVAGDPEIAAFRDYLGASSPKWLAYVEARKLPTREARQARYRDETDALRLKADEDFTIGSEDWLAAVEAWKAAKAAIRAELPYEVE